ncbi:hypothetical protein LX32DRAFT_182455 [Colletotrichum zoysiae]|uniref:Uncharacterized protein n=1 Tax=Colletotrichum zoysiae TaxID=1216348 RepID=A0AAD9M5K5_9PEZI|nr:hypothetical protein LX32DRAFT_182455 [Colletotrichum zoysiae]
MQSPRESGNELSRKYKCFSFTSLFFSLSIASIILRDTLRLVPAAWPHRGHQAVLVGDGLDQAKPQESSPRTEAGGPGIHRPRARAGTVPSLVATRLCVYLGEAGRAASCFQIDLTQNHLDRRAAQPNCHQSGLRGQRKGKTTSPPANKTKSIALSPIPNVQISFRFQRP